MKILNIDSFYKNLPQKLATTIEDIICRRKLLRNLEFDISVFQLNSLCFEIHMIEDADISFNFLSDDLTLLIDIKDKDHNQKISIKVINHLESLVQKDLKDISNPFQLEETLINLINYSKRLKKLGSDSNVFDVSFDFFKSPFNYKTNQYSNFINSCINLFDSSVKLVDEKIGLQVLKIKKIKFLNFKLFENYQLDTILPLIIVSWNWQEIILKELKNLKEDDFSKKLEYINQCLQNLQELCDVNSVENVYFQKIEFNALFDWIYEIENQYYTFNNINIDELSSIQLGEFPHQDIVDGGIINSEITPIYVPINIDDKIISFKNSVRDEIKEYFYISNSNLYNKNYINETLDLIYEKKFDKLFKLKIKLTTIKPNAFISRLLFKLHINENSYSLEDLQILHETGCIVNLRSGKPINNHLFRNTKSTLNKLGHLKN